VNARFTPAARADVSAARQWYRDRNPGIDSRFLQAVDSAVSAISAHPEIGHEIEPGIRRYLVRGFPYTIFYRLYSAEFVVVACLHAARDPESWPRSGAV